MTQALAFVPIRLPSANGSVEAYIQAAQRAPLLSEAEEQALARRFRDAGDLEAARQLVLSHLRLVIAVARGYLGYGLPHADLIQEGNIGLMKAVKRFDPERGVRLVSFAIHWIKAEIHEYVIRNWRMVKVATTKAQRKLFFNLRSMKADSRSLNTAETEGVARALGVKAQEVREMEARMGGADLALDPSAEEEDGHFAPIAYLAADATSEPLAALERRERDWLETEGLQAALAQLDARSRAIVERRWLADDEQPPATLHELAAEYGVSAERIRQIEVKALQKMRLALAAAH